MRELVFILTDFIARPVSESPAVVAPGALPRLPALEALLTRGTRCSLQHDWRSWLAGHLGVDSDTSLAATVAAAWPPSAADASGHHWLATPVHLFAGLDSVHVHPLGLLQLSSNEQQQLVEQFNQVFADSPWRLRSIGQRELLMSGPPLYASAADPAGFAGADPSAGLARGPDAASLKRLGAELELWLFEHPLNRQREQSTALPITTLWLWGGPLVPAESLASGNIATRRAARLAALRLYGRDSYAEALCRLAGGTAEPRPSQLEVAALRTDEPDHVILFSLSEFSAGGAGAWEQFEQRWLAPALGALRTRRVRALRLLAGCSMYRLSWPHLGRFWRGRTPWWRELMA